jgi:hypothetical protein
MKIQVMRTDGQVETLNLIGRVQVIESAPGGQGHLLIESTGTSHFFRAEDGAYDGWGMDVSDEDGALSEKDAAEFIKAVEKDRKIHQPGKAA